MFQELMIEVRGSEVSIAMRGNSLKAAYRKGANVRFVSGADISPKQTQTASQSKSRLAIALLTYRYIESCWRKADLHIAGLHLDAQRRFGGPSKRAGRRLNVDLD